MGTRVSMEVIVTIVSKLVYNLFRGRIQPTYIGVIIHLLSTIGIPVCCWIFFATPGKTPKTRQIVDLLKYLDHPTWEVVSNPHL